MIIRGAFIGFQSGNPRKKIKTDENGQEVGHDRFYTVEVVDGDRSRKLNIQDGRDLDAFRSVSQGEMVEVEVVAYPKRGVFKRRDGGEYSSTAFEVYAIGLRKLGAAELRNVA